jgi:hypothetical protein
MLVLPQDQRFYVCEFFCSHAKNKKEISYHNIPGFSEKIVKLNNLLFEKLSPHLDSDFSLVAFKI